MWTPDESRGGSYIINAEILDGPDRGEDVVIAGRAVWSSGYFQAELYKLLLEELGYNVSDPSELELDPNNGYTAMAQGYMDYWPNSWYPGSLAFLEDELPDGTLVGDHVSIVGEEMIQGGLQGFVVTKSFADEYGLYTMDDLNSNADALAAFDATDSVPGNGIADIFGCPEAWTCDNIIENMIAFSGWDNIAQITADYDAMFAQAVDRANEGVPMVAFIWAPSRYITQLWPGTNVYVMGMNNVLDDSNPADQPEGELHDQRGPDGSGGFAAIGPDQCPSAAVTDDGKCPIGWLVADILVTANNEFLEANPVAEALFEAVKLSVIDVSLANAEQDGGASPTDLAIQWIADNRDLVDEWLAAARADVVIAGRANWSSGYFQAELYKLLLEELGYNVSDPSELELDPYNGYTAMAQGYMDYWPNSWYPAHLGWLEAELPDGSLVGDHVTVVGEEMIQGALQGFVVTKSFADEYGVYTMDDLNSNADALAAFDATDSVPGNGVADIFGCYQAWTCANIIENMIAFSGWDNIAQITADYDAMFAQAVDRANEGVPMVAFTWSPSEYIIRLWRGANVYVMGMNKVLDDSNPADQPEGEMHDQRGADGSGGFAAIGPDQCPSAAVTDDGKCPIGWLVNDILVTARNEFLEANPVAEALFEAVRLPVLDVLGNADLQQFGGWSPTDLAIQWIADNRDLVDEWLAAARAAA